MFTITIAQDNDASLWTESVNTLFSQTLDTKNKPCDKSLYFDWRWKKIIRSTFGHTPYYLLVKNNQNIEAACPLFHVSSKLFGSSLISLPYLNGGGIISQSQDAKDFLLSEIKKLHSNLKCDYTELRERAAVDFKDNIITRNHKVAMVLPLMDDPEKLFSSFTPKLRSQIRRPTKEGCSAKIIQGNEITHNDTNQFYSVFSTHMRDLGTPVFPKKLFSYTLELFGKDAALCIVEQNNKPIASGIIVKKDNYIEIPWAASLMSKRKFAPNMLLYWEILKYSCLSGAKYFDFGRSSIDSGTFKFKAQWGASQVLLHWYYPAENSNIPDINPDSKKFELLVNTWKKLPLLITNTVGPYITKSLP